MNGNARRPEEGAGIRNKLIRLFSRSDDPMIRLRQKMTLQAAAFVCVCLVILGVLFGMTAAWYTNVAKSEALTVKAAAWGFDAEVVNTNDPDAAIPPITAIPGDSGDLRAYTVKNKAAMPVNVLAQVDKSSMDPEMQKRIYFYMEDANHAVTWLTSDKGWLFTMEAAGTKDNENHPLDQKSLETIHWLWVYDLVGYTVRASVSIENGQYILAEQEYLSPVVYDPYDPGTIYNAGGVLQEADGKTLAELLEDWNAGAALADYAAQFNGLENYPGYYVIGTPDFETGTVELLYLLPKAEIETATVYDTQHAGEEFTPTLVFTGENADPSQQNP